MVKQSKRHQEKQKLQLFLRRNKKRIEIFMQMTPEKEIKNKEIFFMDEKRFILKRLIDYVGSYFFNKKLRSKRTTGNFRRKIKQI